MCCGMMSPPFNLFLEIIDVVLSRPKRKRTIQIVTSVKFKSQCLLRNGRLVGNMPICEDVIIHEGYIHILEQPGTSGMFLLVSMKYRTQQQTAEQLEPGCSGLKLPLGVLEERRKI